MTNDLRVRSAPYVGGDSLKLEPLLWKGASLFVMDGPVDGSGYSWFLVEPLPEVDVQVHPDLPKPGWVAASSPDGQPWIAPAPSDCYEAPLDWLQFDLTAHPIGLDGLACFGDQPLQFSAWASFTTADGCRATTGPWTITPAWLAPCPDAVYRLAPEGANITTDVNTLGVTIAPSVDVDVLNKMAPSDWLLMDVVGQYDHPAASTCRAKPTGGDGEGPPIPEVVVLDCRSQFVVTSLFMHRDT